MPLARLYFYLENLGLTDPQRDTLVAWFRDFDTCRSPYPERNMQLRTRPDGQAVIFEDLINPDWLTASNVRSKLGEIFGVDPTTITVVVLSSPYGEAADFERPAGTKRLRFGVFAGRTATVAESRSQAAAYLADNPQWEA